MKYAIEVNCYQEFESSNAERNEVQHFSSTSDRKSDRRCGVTRFSPSNERRRKSCKIIHRVVIMLTHMLRHLRLIKVPHLCRALSASHPPVFPIDCYPICPPVGLMHMRSAHRAWLEPEASDLIIVGRSDQQQKGINSAQGSR